MRFDHYSIKNHIITMKRVNIIYWIFTGLLILFMLSSVIGTFFFPNPQSNAMLAKLGYLPYIMKFLAVAKALGIIALFIPGFPRIKEWVYAGFTFDLLGASFSFIASGFPLAQWAPFLIPGLLLIAISYSLWHKKLKMQGQEL